MKQKVYYYVPKKENPVQIEITNITHLHNDMPDIMEGEIPDIIEGKIDGVLYRADNPQDSIVVNGIFGAK